MPHVMTIFAFFYSRCRWQYLKYFIKHFYVFLKLKIIEDMNMWRSFTNHCRKHTPLLGLILQALLRPRIDLGLHMDRPPMQNLNSNIHHLCGKA